MTTETPREVMLRELATRNGRGSSITWIDEPEPEPLFCPIISADDHALEPPTLFEGRLPRAMEEDAPRIEIDGAGTEWWRVDGILVPNLVTNSASGRPVAEWGHFGSNYDEIRPAILDSKVRLADMDTGGVWASLCFPSVIWGFAGTRLARIRDQKLGLACLRAYNDWMIEEWCGGAPDRYIPCQLTWLSDAEVAAEEIRRNAARGYRSVSFSENPEALGFPSIYERSWDPFFRACEETETVINLHVGSSGITKLPSTQSGGAVAVALFPESGIEALVDWIFAFVPLRFPGLQIALSEAGVSWVPMALERLSRAYRQRDSTLVDWPSDALPPQDVARRNFLFTSIEDPSAFRLLDLIGEDRVMVETDYPHFDSTWPACQSMLRYQLESLPPETVKRVCYENAARVYRHPLPPSEMIERSEVGRADFARSDAPR